MQTQDRPYFYLGANWGLTRLTTGHLFYVNTDDRQIAPWIISRGSWEDFVDDIICAYVQPGMTVIDVGANIGYYTVKLASKVGPSGKVFSFEPHPHLVPFLSQNIAISGFEGRCTLFPVALGDQQGKADLLVTPGNLGGGQINEPRDRTQEKRLHWFRVEVTTLDQQLSKERIDFLKLDAEGHEPLVLRGGQELIGRSPDCAFVVEVTRAEWNRFGTVPDLLGPISRKRLIFAITPQTRLVPVELNEVGAYLDRTPNGQSYFLILPARPELLNEVGRFRQ